MSIEFAADVVLFAGRPVIGGGLYVLLIERGGEPFAGKLALPGGYVEQGERIVEGAARELREETGIELDPTELHLVGIYDEPGRDPRGDVKSAAYTTWIEQRRTPTAADDAAAAAWVPVSDALQCGLAFDHERILRDALQQLYAAQPWYHS